MNIDYDGLQHDLQCELERGERDMLDQLQEAIHDGEVAPCRLLREWQICEVCYGNGGHSRRLGVIGHEAWSEWDDDSRASYATGGYDAPCDRCSGTGKVAVVAYGKLPADVQGWIDDYYRGLHEDAMTRHAERRAGC